MSKTDPYRFPEESMPQQEKDLRFMQEELIATSGMSDLEKFMNFPVFVDRVTMSRFLVRYELFKMVVDIPGSIFECGVLFGGGVFSFALFSSIFEPFNAQRRVVGFDTFKGLPKIHEKDHSKTPSSKLHEGAMGYDSHDELMKAAKCFDMNRPIPHLPKIELVRGDIEESMQKYLDENPHVLISLLYIDLDLYLGTKAALEACLPRMPKGSIIAFDEFACERWPGETVALLETLGVQGKTLKRFPFDSYASYLVL